VTVTSIETVTVNFITRRKEACAQRGTHLSSKWLHQGWRFVQGVQVAGVERKGCFVACVGGARGRALSIPKQQVRRDGHL